MRRFLLSCVLGLTAGLIGGAFGLAGSLVMIPGLMFLNIITNYQKVVGTVLFAVLPPISILAVLERGRRKEIDYTVGVTISIMFTLAAYFGARWARFFSDVTLKYCTAVILLILSLFMFYSARTC